MFYIFRPMNLEEKGQTTIL